MTAEERDPSRSSDRAASLDADGGSEAFAFDNILIEGDAINGGASVPTPAALPAGLLLSGGELMRRRRSA